MQNLKYSISPYAYVDCNPIKYNNDVKIKRVGIESQIQDALRTNIR